MKAIAALLLAISMMACGSAAKRTPAWPDAPMELRDDSDRDEAIDKLWVLPAGAERDAVRTRIADAIVDRIADAIEDDKPYNAEQLLFELCSLWETDAGRVGVGLSRHAKVVTQLRAMFAKSGALEPTIATLTLLAEIDVAHRDEHLAEIDEVLNFSDDLESAENGPEAQRAQPIELLQPTVLALPLPCVLV